MCCDRSYIICALTAHTSLSALIRNLTYSTMADEDIEEIADKFAGKFDSITCSSRYDKNVFQHRELKISQAMCLLWQNSTTGGVAGRHNDLHLLVGVYCAALLDLLLLEKISINDVMLTCLCLVSKKKIVEVSSLITRHVFLIGAS